MKCATVLAIAIPLAASTAHAQWFGGDDDATDSPYVDRQSERTGNWYVAFGAGMTFPDEVDLSEIDGELEFDDGFGVHGSVGRFLGPLRIEGEVAYRANDFDSLDVGGVNVGVDGELTSLSLMANVFYDHAISDRLDLYVGGGIGASYAEGELQDVGGVMIDVDDDDVVFAWQFLAGAAYALSDNLALTGGYRMFGTDDYEFEDTEIDSPLIHSVEVGLRVTF